MLPLLLVIHCNADYAHVLQQLANTSIIVRDHLTPEQPIPSNMSRQLIANIQLMSLLLKDCWAAVKSLEGLVANDKGGADASGAANDIHASAGSAAVCGHSLLAGLVAVSKSKGDVDDCMKGMYN